MMNEVEQPNIDFFEKLAQGDISFKKKLIETLKQDFFDDYKNYNTKLVEQDYSQIKFYVHRIKHKIGILGLKESFKMATQYEEELKLNNLNLKSEFEKTLKKIKVFLNQKK